MGLIRIGSSLAPQAEAAVEELAGQLAGAAYALVVFFSADTYDLPALARGMRAAFPASTRLIGCTTAGEIGLSGYQNDSVVAIAFPADEFAAATAVIPDLASFNMTECRQRVEEALRQATWQSEAGGFQSSLALLLVDGLSLREEAVGQAVQLMLGKVPVIGGSAGDSLRFQQTLVFDGDRVLDNAAVLAILSTNTPFRIVKTQHFERTDVRMVVTEARPQERIVTEINGFPAAIEYARIVGIPLDSLSPMAFAAYPVVVRIGGHEYVRSIQKVNPDNSLSFYCAIDRGIVLSRANGLDALANLEQALDAVADEIGPLQAVLACDCILRNLEFRQRDQVETISRALRERNVVGFSTFGELHLGIHVNQTFTGIAFGQAQTAGSGAK